MKIAVASQNRRDITEHAGRCRKFWIYRIAEQQIMDKALLAGFSEVEVVHGRGTGALRRQVHDFLRSFPAVGQFALAPEDRGGDGMTIVTFR